MVSQFQEGKHGKEVSVSMGSLDFQANFTLSDDLLPISNVPLKSLNDLNSQQFLRYL